MSSTDESIPSTGPAPPPAHRPATRHAALALAAFALASLTLDFHDTRDSLYEDVHTAGLHGIHGGIPGGAGSGR